MRRFLISFVCGSLMIAFAIAQDRSPREAARQDWLFCQAGNVEKCDRLLRLKLDDETRMLVEADRQLARDKIAAHVRALLHVCDTRGSVRSCDLALRFNLTAVDRQEVLNVRKAVVQRRLLRDSR